MQIQNTLSQNIYRFYRGIILPGKRYIITTVVLMASAYLAYFGTRDLFLAILVAFAGVVGAIYLYKYMHLGPLLLVGVSFLVGISVGGGDSTSINATILLTAALAGLMIVDMILVKKKIEFSHPRTYLPLFLLILVSIIAFFNGQLPWFNFAQQAPLIAQIGGVMTFVIAAAVFIVAVELIKDTIWLKRLVWLFLLIGTAFLITRFVPQLLRLGNRTFAYGSTASLFWLWMVVHTASQGFFNQKLSRPIRALLIALLGLTLYFSVIITYDFKSGWIPSLAALVVIFWIGAPKLRPIALMGAGMVVLLYFVDIQSLVTGNEDYSVLTRVEAWGILLEIIKVNPILGLGPANYYWFTPLYSILGYNVSFSSHNNYIDIIAQVGIFGLVFFGWFIYQLTKSGFNSLKIAPAGFERAYVIGAIGGIAGTLVAGMLGDWIIPFVYNVGLVGFRSSVFGWIFFGGLIALGLILNKRAQSDENVSAEPTAETVKR